MARNITRVLIVEDDYFIAKDLAASFKSAGLQIVGPVPSLEKALVAIEQGKADGAILDVNLYGEKVYEVADALIGRGIPVVFVTGYDRPSLPKRYAAIPLCVKPVESGQVVAALSGVSSR